MNYREVEVSFERQRSQISLLSKVIAACCALHNLREVHGDAFNEEWAIASAKIPSSEAAGMTTVGSNNAESIHNVLADYLHEDYGHVH